MDELSKKILERVGINTDEPEIFIERDILLSTNIYDSIKADIPELRKIYSSSSLTSLQQTADTCQKWPLLNLIRQILHVYSYQMKPIRKSDGYTVDGVKKFKRFFLIEKKVV